MTARHLISLSEAAERLDICTKTLQRLIDRREIRYVMVGRRRKIDALDVERFIEGNKEEAPCPSISRRGGNTTRMTSKSTVYDFEAARERSRKRRLSRSSRESATR
jgi:excisionase family DNA binding protein